MSSATLIGATSYDRGILFGTPLALLVAVLPDIEVGHPDERSPECRWLRSREQPWRLQFRRYPAPDHTRKQIINTLTDMLSIKQVCRLFPGRAGHGISQATIMRWMLHGVGGTRLASTKVGGVRYSSRPAVDEFIAILNKAKSVDAGPANSGAVNRTSTPITAAHQERLARIDRQLDAEGF